MQLQSLEVGKRFAYARREWILLDRHEDRHLCVCAECDGARQFDRGMTARFDQGALCEWLNGEYYTGLIRDGASAIDFSPLMMHLGMSTTEGDCIYTKRVGILSLHQWRRFMTGGENALHPVWRWQWTCTISEGIFGQGLCCVAGKSGNYVYYPPNHPEPLVRPAVCLRGWAEVSVKCEERS